MKSTPQSDGQMEGSAVTLVAAERDSERECCVECDKPRVHTAREHMERLFFLHFLVGCDAMTGWDDRVDPINKQTVKR